MTQKMMEERPDTARPVYAVIPVFNRLQRTLKCIDCLKNQTYQPIHIIVSDGGSTDGTREEISRQHPDVTVVMQDGLFWGGSTRLGIDEALKRCSEDEAFVLMVNNDTEFESNYVNLLVAASQKHNVAIGGVVVDENDTDIIVDGGVDFSWDTYSFRGRYSKPAEPFDPVQPTDVLPGRGTIIPLSAIRKAGNVDGENFPHYLSDYEFTYRLKTRGDIGLAVHFEAIIKTETPPPPSPPSTDHPLKQAFRELQSRFNRRSKRNLFDHLRFIKRHAPESRRNALRRRHFLSSTRSAIKPATEWLRNSFPVRVALAPYRILRWLVRSLYRVFVGPYLIHDSDIDAFGLDRHRLGQHQITVPSGFSGYLLPGRRRRYLKQQYPEAVVLYRRASAPHRKIARFLDTRGFWPTASNPVFGPYLIADADIDQLGLDRLKLGQHQITVASRFSGYRRPNRRLAYLREHYPEALPLYGRANNPFRKLARFFMARIGIPELPGLGWLKPGVWNPVFGPYLIADADIDQLGLDRLKLGQHQITVASRFSGYRRPNRRRAYLREHYPEALPLYGRANNPFRKLARFLKTRLKLPWLKNRVPSYLQPRVFFGPVVLSDADIDALGLDREKLGEHSIILPTSYPGYRRPGRSRAYLTKHYPEALPLYRRSAMPHWKVYHGLRLLRLRYRMKRERKAMAGRTVSTDALTSRRLPIDALLNEHLIAPSTERANTYVLTSKGVSSPRLESWVTSLALSAKEV